MPAVETTVTMLEMTAEPQLHVATPALPKMMLMHVEKPTAGFYRFLYGEIGRDFSWIDRAGLSDAELTAIIQDEAVGVWVCYVAGQPAGYFEVDARRAPAVVELLYLGLVAEFRGRGLGKWLALEAVRACWSHKPERVIVETCTLDGPAALPLYQRIGFAPYARRTKLIERT